MNSILVRLSTTNYYNRVGSIVSGLFLGLEVWAVGAQGVAVRASAAACLAS